MACRGSGALPSRRHGDVAVEGQCPHDDMGVVEGSSFQDDTQVMQNCDIFAHLGHQISHSRHAGCTTKSVLQSFVKGLGPLFESQALATRSKLWRWVPRPGLRSQALALGGLGSQALVSGSKLALARKRQP